MSSSPSYQGRHRVPGRHRAPRRGPRIPAGFRGGFVLPTAAAAALVVTTTGATVAESSPVHLDLAGTQAKSRAQSAALAEFDRVEATQQRELQVTTAESRAVEAQRIARSAERAAVAKKKVAAAAIAKAEAKRKNAEKWLMPIKGAVFTSGFGWRWGRMHQGDDFGTPVGTPLHAMSTGTIVFAGVQGGYGNKVEIEYWDGTVSVYGHMNSISVKEGDKVAPGDLVGTSGNTGHSTGPHLHLEIHPEGGAAIDPAPWLKDHGLQ
ncbi:M23 family metallopeptidase [Phycicoccus sp. Root563]|uniref:M23 family metallopeptidase n=1 Tax=Phycicoccus sp. Root563 TaxID=1736562 RepID=UPI000A7E4212|nr:M23 family metallopeptidase [Phycicoccus sp. Root563]